MPQIRLNWLLVSLLSITACSHHSLTSFAPQQEESDLSSTAPTTMLLETESQSEAIESTTLTGTVERLPSQDLTGFWIVEGIWVWVSSRTEIGLDTVTVGDQVEVRGRSFGSSFVFVQTIASLDQVTLVDPLPNSTFAGDLRIDVQQPDFPTAVFTISGSNGVASFGVGGSQTPGATSYVINTINVATVNLSGVDHFEIEGIGPFCVIVRSVIDNSVITPSRTCQS